MKRILVVDVPRGATAEEAEQLLNAPYDEGYYLDRLFDGFAEGIVRGFYKLRVKPERDGAEDEAALAIVKEHPKASVREVVEFLKQAGIKRGRSWVSQKRFELYAGPLNV